MRGASLPSVAVAFASLLAPAAGAAAPERGATEERAVASLAPDAEIVRESFVRVYDPLPASAGAHPEPCDWVSYLRFRHARGPARARDAEAVAVLMPGFLGGAGYFDQLARNTVRLAGERGRYIEVWSLDRRSNCLEDHTGVDAAARTGDPAVAYDYYWGGQAVDGKRFGGFASPTGVDFLKEFGLERTVRDWHAVIEAGFPDPAERTRKVICGGHSLGGPLTTAFAGWDFDGDPATTEDAGYNQCAAYAGFDTRLSLMTGPARPGGGGFSTTTLFTLLSAASGAPFMNATPLTPETFQLPPIFGVGAYHGPQAMDLIRALPRTPNIDLAQRLLFSRDAVNFATGIPSIRDFNLSNETVLAGVFDDNSAPLSFLRASLGFFTGGPAVDKNFPFQGDGTYALPGDTRTPLYAWQNYDAVGDPLVLNEAGKPYTSRESEVSDVRQLARTMFEAPADFIEQYFPTRILEDVGESGSFRDLRYDGIAKRPAILIQAGDSDENSAPDEGEPIIGNPPNAQLGSRTVTLPGYNHIDVVSAARTQNDGRPEPSSSELAGFMLAVAGPPAIRLSVSPSRLRAGRRVRMRFVARGAGGCGAGAVIRIAGRRVRTDSRGRARLSLRVRRAGAVRVRATKRGCLPAAFRLRVVRAS